MGVKIDERFAAQCSVVFSNNYDTQGSITRSSIDYLTPSQLESLFAPGGLFADLDAWFKTAFEMKACGTRTFGLYDWIMSGSDRTKGKAALNTEKTMGMNPGVMFPFILGKQESVINIDFWAISAGGAQSAYTAGVTGPLTSGDLALAGATDRYVRVVSRYGIDLDAKWFVDRDRVNIFTRQGGFAQMGQWKVMASAVATDLSYVDVLLKSENSGSSTPFWSAPTSGVLLPSVNNVNDFEKWCNNRPNYDGRKRVPFWFQTMRRTRRIDQLYLEYFKRLNQPGVNEAFKEFGDMDLAKRNAQDELNWQKRFCTAFFFNKPIGPNQTLALWENLDDISSATSGQLDTGMGGKVITKRANFIGVYEQLLRCDRVRDLQNQPMNYYEWLDENYRIHRARQTRGKANAMSIDWYTDSISRALMQSAYVAYLKAEYGSTNVQFPVKLGERNSLGFVWDSFEVKHPAGVQINIISHEFFDDWRDANKTENQESLGIMLLCLDLGKGGSIYWSQLASNRRVNRVGDLKDLAPIDKDFACVMETLTEEITMTSETGTAVVECPSDNLWIWNMADAVPLTTGKSANPNYTNLY
jgi:hypothetical protein